MFLSLLASLLFSLPIAWMTAQQLYEKCECSSQCIIHVLCTKCVENTLNIFNLFDEPVLSQNIWESLVNSTKLSHGQISTRQKEYLATKHFKKHTICFLDVWAQNMVTNILTKACLFWQVTFKIFAGKTCYQKFNMLSACLAREHR